MILNEINELGSMRNLNSLEKPKEIFMSSEEFTVENDIMTPTFKLKRNVCKKVYQAQIDQLYEVVMEKEAAMNSKARD